MARVWARRSSENTTGTRWRVCIYHNAPSETACPVISSKHKPWAQSWISSIGSGLGLPRLYSTGFRLPAHEALCPARLNNSPPTPARCESARIGADRRRSVAKRKGESGACPDFPFGFRLKVRSSFQVFFKVTFPRLRHSGRLKLR